MDSIQDRLTYYLIKNDFDQVLLALEHGADPNIISDSIGFESPLHLAIHRQNDALMHALILKGANVNGPPTCEYPPLHTAVFSAKVSAADILIRYNADVNLKSHDEKTPLHMAILSEDYPENDDANNDLRLTVIDLLISRGARVYDEQLLWYAIDKNDHRSVKRLLDASKDVSLNQHSMIKLLFSADDENATTVEAVLTYMSSLCKEGAAVSVVNHISDKYDGYTPLHRAAESGFVILTRHLMKLGADPTIRDKEFKTPIDLARACRHFEVIEEIENEMKHRTKLEKKYLQKKIENLEESVLILEEKMNDQKVYYEDKLLDQVFILQQQQMQIENLQKKLEQVLQFLVNQ